MQLAVRKRIIQQKESFPAETLSEIKTEKAVQARGHMPAIVALKSSRKKSSSVIDCSKPVITQAFYIF